MQERSERGIVVLLGHHRPAWRALSDAMPGLTLISVDDRAPAWLQLDERFLVCPGYWPADAGDEWARWMCEQGRALTRPGAAPPVLFATSDRALLAVARHHARLRDAFVLADPPPALVHTLVDKAAFARRARAGSPDPGWQAVAARGAALPRTRAGRRPVRPS